MAKHNFVQKGYNQTTPILIHKIDNEWRTIDGHHRLIAMDLLPENVTMKRVV